MKKDITNLFCFVDDFAQAMQKEITSYLLSQSKSLQMPTRTPELSDSEIMTIVLMFQESPCRNFKYFYNSYLQLYRQDFPKMPTYERFVTLKPRILLLAVVLLHALFSPDKKLGYIDATSLAVCHPKRIRRNKVFKGLAALGKTTKGWFFGFKLHVIVDEKGNLLRAKLTPGNVDDRAVVDGMTQDMTGLLFGDKGYIDKKLFLKLYERGLKIVTGIRKNMKNILISWNEKVLLRKRSIIETVFDYLKNKMQLEHTRHRSPWNMFVHLISTLIVYQLKPSKPSICYDFALPNP
jgi:transposase